MAGARAQSGTVTDIPLPATGFASATDMHLSDEEFRTRWTPLEARFRAVDDTYQSEKIRKNGQPYPVGQARSKLDEALSEACDLYMDARPDQRGRMRDYFERSRVPRLYLLEVGGTSMEVANEPADRALRQALASVSLDNCGEFRDTFTFLARIQEASVSRGLDPKPFFEEAAGWSSSEEDCRIMRDLFARFGCRPT